MSIISSAKTRHRPTSPVWWKIQQWQIFVHVKVVCCMSHKTRDTNSNQLLNNRSTTSENGTCDNDWYDRRVAWRLSKPTVDSSLAVVGLSNLLYHYSLPVASAREEANGCSCIPTMSKIDPEINTNPMRNDLTGVWRVISVHICCTPVVNHHPVVNAKRTEINLHHCHPERFLVSKYTKNAVAPRTPLG